MIKIDIKQFEELTYEQKDARSKYRSIHIKKDYQLDELIDLYPKKIERLSERLKEGKLDKEEFAFLTAKIERLTDKYATTLGEIDIRKNKIYERIPIGTTYYIDLDNGNNARTGLKIGPSTIDSTADTTHFVDDLLTGADDYINGSYFYNVTRSLGSLITDFVALTDTVTLADAIAGMTAGDTYYILDAWETLEQYTTTTERNAGDIAYVRANTTETVGANDILFDEDGTVNSYISIIGCDSVTNDPWVDGSDVRPIIDFGDQIHNMVIDSDHYWKIERLDIIQSADTAGNLYCSSSKGLYLLNCIIRDNSAASDKYGIQTTFLYNFKFESCQLLDNVGTSMYSIRSSGIIDNCVFNGGVTTTNIGARGEYANLLFKSCTFGITTAHTSEDVYAVTSSFVHIINCARNKTYFSASSGSVIFAEDDNQVKGANKVYHWNGDTIKDTGVVRSGGAPSSAKLQPNSNCGLYAPLSVTPFNEYDFPIYCSATETTLRIRIRSLGVWAAYPTNTELYIEASYLDHAADATRTLIASTQVLNDETTWQVFTVTFTPLQEGYVYLKVYLKKFEADKGCYIDMKVNNQIFDWSQAMPIELKPSSTGFILL